MADLYWVGGNGTWDDSTTANWASSTGGSPGAGPSTATSNVFFDGSSGTGTVNVASAPLSANCNNFDASQSSITTFNQQENLNINGNFILKSGIQWIGNTNYISIVYGHNHSITTNGVIFNSSIYMGGSVLLNDNLTLFNYLDNQIDIWRGTVNLNGKTLTTPKFINEDTIIAGTSTINVTSGGGEFTGNEQTYYIVNITGAFNNDPENFVNIHQSNTFNTLNLSPGVTVEPDGGEVQTCTNFNANGNATNRITLIGGSQYTISASNVSVSFVDPQNCTAVGATPFFDYGGIDGGGNINWVFPNYGFPGSGASLADRPKLKSVSGNPPKFG